MKKETTYSLLLAVTNIPVFVLNLMAQKTINKHWEETLSGQPLPALTEFIAAVSLIWPIVFILVFVGLTILSLKKEKLSLNLMVCATCIELLFIMTVAFSFTMPAINIMYKIGPG